MIGWWIVVAAQTPEERDQAVDRRAAVLANWEVGPGGIEWLHQLVKSRANHSGSALNSHMNQALAKCLDSEHF